MKRLRLILGAAGLGMAVLATGVAHSQTRQVVTWGANACDQSAIPAANAGFVAVAAGNFHSLGLKSDGTIVAWGFDGCGRTEVPLPNADFLGIAAGGYHSLALKSNGNLVAFGCNDDGQIDVPEPNANFVAVGAGDAHSVGLKSDGSVVAWGNDDFGQSTVPAPNSGFISVAAGFYHSLGLRDDGTIVAWGFNGDGQCDVPAPNADFVAVAAGGAFSLGLKSDGTIVGWGDNTSGQCDVPLPNANFVAVAAGADHSLGLKTNGTIVAWGENATGQCDVPAPNTGFTALAGGSAHSVGVRAAATLFVDWDAAGSNTGASWLDAYTDLQSALAPAEPGTSIWVAAGTYPPATGVDRTVAFQMKNGVAVYGGFSGVETTLPERDWLANATVLSGDIGVPADSTDNSYHVVIGSHVDATAVLDGFTVTAGRGDGDYPHDAGGGLHNDAGSPTIRNVAFSRNSSRLGGGAYNRGLLYPIFTNVIFSRNSAESGGGIYNQDAASPTVTNAVFWQNVAIQGGGMYNNVGSFPTLTNVTLARNVASSSGGAIHNETTLLTLINAILWEDSAAVGNEIANNAGSITLVSYSLVNGSEGSGPGWNPAIGTDGGSNLDADPMFVDLPGGDLRLANASPAVNAGSNAAPNLHATDLNGDPRIIGNRVDMGAYENLVGAVAPLAVHDATSVEMADSVAIDVLANDTDIDGSIDSTSVAVVTPPVHGTAVADTTTGEITYTHDGSASAADTLTYTVRDDDGLVSNVASIYITIVERVAPVAVNDSSAVEAGDSVVMHVLANDTDSDGTIDSTSVTVVTPAVHGTAVVNATTGVITYTQDGSASAADSLTYSVRDDDGLVSNVASVYITIGAIPNTAPVAEDDEAALLVGGTLPIDVLENDTDSDGSIDSTSVTVVTPPVHGTAKVDTTTGEITYTHTGSATGTDSLTYTVRDNDGAISNVASVRISIGTLTGVGDPLTAPPPKAFALHQNSPNPFNPSTTIVYDVPAGGGSVQLDVYDVRGRLVTRLVDGRQSAGQRQVRWDGTDRRGQRVSSGVYFCRLTAPGFQGTRKMVLVE